MSEGGEDCLEERRRRRRIQLGTFLRARRAMLQPVDLGLPERRRRHVPGLRREELAQLADVSVSWYALVEQGRIERVSLKALRRIASVLRLNAIESEHALSLAHDLEEGVTPSAASAEPIYDFVRAYRDGPAFASGPDARVLAWNSIANGLFRFEAYAESDRRMLALMVRDSHVRAVFVEWEYTLERMIGVLRASYAEFGNADLDAFVRALRAESQAFDTLWGRYTVDSPATHVCLLRPAPGIVTRFDFIAFAPIDHPKITVVALRALDQ